MHDLAPLCALGGGHPRIDVFDRITITENAAYAYASIAAHKNGAPALNTVAVKQVGVALPAPGQMTCKADITAIWRGPDQWLLEAPFVTHELMAHDLAIKLAGLAAITEQNDAFVRFDLAGDLCVDVLERLCAVNSQQMVAGNALHAAIEHMTCFIICRIEGNFFSILGTRSSAKSLHHALINAVNSTK